jgi:hypothetical protein
VFKLIFHHPIVLDDILTVPAMRDYIQYLRLKHVEYWHEAFYCFKVNKIGMNSNP